MKIWLLPLLVLLAGVGCSRRDGDRHDAALLGEDLGRRLTEGECEAAIDHAVRLAEEEPAAADVAALMTDDRAARVAECVAVGTLRDHRCLMTALTFDELGLCPRVGKASP